VKKCRICQTEKDLADFPARSDAKDGVRNECQLCHNARQKATYERRKDAWRVTAHARYVRNRDQVVEDRRRYRATNAAEINSRRRELHAANPEKYRQQKREWLAANPGKKEAHAIRVKARQRDIRALGPDDLSYVMVVRRDPCSYCSGPGGTWDHIEAHANGGPSAWENSTGACAACNASKKDQNLLLWLAAGGRSNTTSPA
jgi:hypothetical protein